MPGTDKPARPTYLGILRCCLLNLLILAVTVASVITQIIISPVRYFSVDLSYRLNSYIVFSIWYIIDYCFSRLDGVRIRITGLENVPLGESAFVIANHRFSGDYAPINHLALSRGMLPYLRYFVKSSVKYIPLFGWGIYLADFPMLKRNWSRDSSRIQKALQAYTQNQLPVWLVSHVEGTRFTPEKQEASNKFAASLGRPPLKHVLLPRCRGFYSTINALRLSHIKYVYDVTLAYYHRERGLGATLSFSDLYFGFAKDYHIHIHVDRIPISSVPVGEKDITEWLYDRYYKKDALLESLKSSFESSARRA